jgi:hypothetical protein
VFILTRNDGALEKVAGRSDAILDTISAEHDLNGTAELPEAGRDPDSPRGVSGEPGIQPVPLCSRDNPEQRRSEAR